MGESIERLWTLMLDSDAFRRFAKRGMGSVLFRSTAYRKLNLAKNYLGSLYDSERNPPLFRDVKTFCLFIGHNKSGTSMIGGLLDAHPNVILSDEADALQYISADFRRDQIYHILLTRSRREAMKGRVTARRLTPYSYWVPDQWQGRYEKLQVIGDGTAGSSTQRFAREPDLLRRVKNVMAGVDVKLIQVIRNPYDPIAVTIVRGKQSFENAIEKYFARCKMLAALRKQLNDRNLLAVRYEDFVRHAEMNLTQVCGFLGIETSAEYLQACTRILHKEPDQNRHLVQWDAKSIDVVKSKMEQFDFLQGYSFEN